MTKMKKKIIAAAIVGVLAVGCVAVGFSRVTPAPSTAQSAELTLEREFFADYKTGALLEIPAGSIVYGGKTYAADEEVVLYCPDGSALKGTRFTLDQAGDYTVTYTATVDGKTVTATRTLTVKALPYGVPNSSAWSFVDTLKTQNATDGATGGLSVELAMGAKFTYNKPIDVTNASLETPIITFSPYQFSNYMLDSTGKPTAEATEMYLRLTDAYDPDNYIDFYMLDRSPTDYNAGYKPYPYVSAGASGQTIMALDPDLGRWQPAVNNGKIVTVDGVEYCAVYENFGLNLGGVVPHGECAPVVSITADGYWALNGVKSGVPAYELTTENGNWAINGTATEIAAEGTPTVKKNEAGNWTIDSVDTGVKAEGSPVVAEGTDGNWTIDGVASGVPMEQVGGKMSVYYDNATKRIYVEAPTRAGNGTVVYRKLVNDLDAAGLYAHNPFKGFTTGEVYVSLWGEEYLDDKLHLEISEIYGKKGAELSDVNNAVTDERDPLLVLDREDLPETLLVKKGERVSLIGAKAYDVHLKGDVQTSVYYLYGTENQTIVNSRGGYFTPTKTGVYTVVYRAEDTYGRSAERQLRFSCIEEEILQFSVEKAVAPKAGETLTLPMHELSSKNGGVALDVYALYGGKRIEMDEETPALFIDYAGEYTIVYEYGDVLENRTYSYSFTSVTSDNIVISTPVLPEYFIKGGKYTLDEVNAYTYKEATPKTVATEVYVKEDGAAEFVKIDAVAYEVNASKKVQFQYVYADESLVSEEIPVVDVKTSGKLDMSKYFVGDIQSSIPVKENGKKEKAVEIKAETISDTATAKFINPLSFSTFLFEFSVPEGADNFQNLHIDIVDYYARDQKVRITYGNGGDVTTLNVAGNETEIARPFEETDFSVWYEGKVEKFMERNGATYDFADIFTTDKVLVEITFTGVRGESAVWVTQMGNQKLSASTSDSAKAALDFLNLDGGLNEIDTVVTVYAAEAIDVLSPFYAKNLVVSVELPSGGYATSVDGTKLEKASANRDWQIKLTEYGVHRVTYEYTDASENPVDDTYIISVVDKVKPEITLENGYNEKVIVKVKVGSTVNVANYTAKDNLTADSELVTVIFVRSANGEFTALTKDSFVVTDKGDYVVYYYCYDTDGNYAVESYTVRAE